MKILVKLNKICNLAMLSKMTSVQETRLGVYSITFPVSLKLVWIKIYELKNNENTYYWQNRCYI